MATTKPKQERIQLPSHFTPTHETVGLPGYPAIDVFAPVDSLILSPEAGTVIRWSGHRPTPTAVPGGPYGWSMYLETATGIYYLTHLKWRKVKVGERVARGAILGSIVDYAGATGGITPSHVHMGKHLS